MGQIFNNDLKTQRELEWKIELEKGLVKEIKKIDKQKTLFVSMVSHELKTPLTPIISWSDLLCQNVYGELNLKQRRAIEGIKKNAEKLSKLLSDILDAQKLDMDKMSFNFRDFDIQEIMEDISFDYENIMKKNGVEFLVHDTDKIIINSDKSRIEQILKNLINNALDFIPEKAAKIEIFVEKQDSVVTFYVKDNGIGISQKNMKQLFKKFYQIDTSYTRKHGGSGIGLAICRGIVECLGGYIGIKSTQNQGSVFYFLVPIKRKNIKK